MPDEAEQQHGDWEFLHHSWQTYDRTFRLRVPGGWLYRYHSGTTTAIAMAFVPDVPESKTYAG